MAIFEKALGPEHPATALSLHQLASLLQDQGDLAAARALFERALTIREKVLGTEHLNTSLTRYSLSRLLLISDQPAEALGFGKNALTACDKAFGPDDHHTKEAALVTADALDALGRAEEAKALRERYGVEGA